jgi:catechol 2,3-dioxygenase-like lactoylglutathione lyase family enzyme
MSRRSSTLTLTLALAIATCTVARSQASQSQPAVAEIPVVGIANVTFKVSDLAKARAYYAGVLGLPQAFEIKDAAGKVAAAFFKINDDQYIEITPNLKAGELIRQGRVVFESTNLEKLQALYTARGLKPGAISRGADGNPVFRVVSPEGNNLDFLQYAGFTRTNQGRGFLIKDVCPPTFCMRALWLRIKRTSLFTARSSIHAGTLPAPRRVRRDTELRDKNTETKHPPLDPDNRRRATSMFASSMDGVPRRFEVPDMRWRAIYCEARWL